MFGSFFRRTTLATVVAFLISAIPIQQAFAARNPQLPLNPKTYCSPSKQYSLHVDPTDRQGRGPGRHVLHKDGRELWCNTPEPPRRFDNMLYNDVYFAQIDQCIGIDLAAQRFLEVWLVEHARGGPARACRSPRTRSPSPRRAGRASD